MRRIQSTIDPNSSEFRAFDRHNRGLVAELEERQQEARVRVEAQMDKLRKLANK